MTAWFDTIEWWETDSGLFNWHAVNSGNHEIIFGSVQGYVSKTTMIQYLSANFPNCAITPRDGEARSSSDVEREKLQAATADEEPVATVEEDDGA